MRADLMASEVVRTIKAALSPVLERIAAAETRLNVLGDLRDRLVAMETKAAQLPDLTDVRDRLVALETRAVGPSADALTVAIGMAPLQERIAVLEARVQAPLRPNADEVAPEDMAASVAGLLRKELADLEATIPPKVRRRIEKDAAGYTITDDLVNP